MYLELCSSTKFGILVNKGENCYKYFLESWANEELESMTDAKVMLSVWMIIGVEVVMPRKKNTANIFK